MFNIFKLIIKLKDNNKELFINKKCLLINRLN